MSKSTSLKRSVMSSSSLLPLSKLFHEVITVDGATLFDLIILRDTDVQEMAAEPRFCLEPPCVMYHDPGRSRDITRALAVPENRDKIVKWIIQQCHLVSTNQSIEIAALDTYFPDITSMHQQLRSDAIAALTSTVLIALSLQEAGLMKHAIVEAVCGTILDGCRCTTCQEAVAAAQNVPLQENECRIFVYDQKDKVATLCHSLMEVNQNVEQALQDTYSSSSARPFALALELEPGETYVLNSLPALEMLEEKLASGEFDALIPHVGLNLDIAHMKIAKISATQLRKYCNRIVHAHISDHPGLHTRDQVVGQWTPIEWSGADYYSYIDLLREREENVRTDTLLPFSAAVALELEGCNRISWIHHSLVAMKYLDFVDAK